MDKRLIPLLAVLFVSTLGFSIVLPFLWILVEDMGGNAFMYGIVGASYSFFQIFGAPLLGRWSDKYGRKPILIISQIGTILSWVLFIVAILIPRTVLSEVDSGFTGAFTLTLPLLLVLIARSFDGLTGGNIAVAMAYLADLSDENDRTANFGRAGIANSLGFIMGPLLASALGFTALGVKLPVFATLGISLVTLGLLVFFLKESHKPKEQHGPREHDMKKVLALRHMKYLLILNFLVFLGFNFFYTALPVFTISDLGWSLQELGYYFSFFALTSIISQGPILKRLSKYLSNSSMILLGNLIIGIGFGLLPFGAQGPIWIYAGALFISFGNSIMFPSLTATIAEHAGSDHQGSAQGLAADMGSIASVLGLVIGGVIYTSLGAGIFFLSAGTFAILTIVTFRLPAMERAEHASGKSEAEIHSLPGEHE